MSDLTQGAYGARRKFPRTVALSQALVNVGFCCTKRRAQQMISAGAVFVDGRRVDTSAIAVGAGVILTIGSRSEPVRFGGLS